MSRGNRSVIAAFAGLVLWSQSPSAQGVASPTPTPKEEANHAAEKGDRQPNPLTVAIVESPEQAIASERREAESRDHNSKDLDAQIRAADSAEKQVVPAWLGAIFSFIGTILIVITLCLTRQANKISRDMFDADIKPFLIIRPCSKDIKFENGLLLPDPIEFEIENSGRSPAIVTGIYREWQMCGYGKFPDPIEHGAQRENWVYKKTHIPIGPGSRSGSIESFNRHLKAKSVEPNSWISFIGYVEFEDIGGTKYIAGFLHIFRLDMPQRGMHLALPEDKPEQYNYHREV